MNSKERILDIADRLAVHELKHLEYRVYRKFVKIKNAMRDLESENIDFRCPNGELSIIEMTTRDMQEVAKEAVERNK